MIDIQAFHKVRDQYKILSRREKFVASKAIKRTIKNLSFHKALLEQEGYKKEAEQIEEAINILQGCH